MSKHRDSAQRGPRVAGPSIPDGPAPATSNSMDAPTLLALYRPDLSAALASQTSPSYRHVQVLAHLMKPGLSSFAEATALPQDMRRLLELSGPATLRPLARREARDGTVKLLLACNDGVRVEAVVMPYRERTTACVSSQAGCPVGCAFCATGAAGFRRNLSVAEIVDQVRFAARVASENGGRLSNVVYMGMGEPLLNLQAVLASIKVLTHPSGLGLGHRSISVSTVGIPAGILRIARSEPQVNLALSLHASTDRTREHLIPPQHRHPLSEILEAAWQHFALTRRKLMVEYLLLNRVNDSAEDARRLASLVRGHVVTVNLLTWNPVLAAGDTQRQRACAPHGPDQKRLCAFTPSPPASVAAFRDSLVAAKIEVTVRESRGADIEAACGQLAGKWRQDESGSR